jgi:lipocalin
VKIVVFGLSGPLQPLRDSDIANIIDLDKEHYGNSLVCGPDKFYLWILARQPVLDESTLDHLLAKASMLGFDTSELIFAKHMTPEQSDDE